eukprot:SAG31_NODE_145_length_22612_cov_5.938169_5_plen_204_part_00
MVFHARARSNTRKTASLQISQEMNSGRTWQQTGPRPGSGLSLPPGLEAEPDTAAAANDVPPQATQETNGPPASIGEDGKATAALAAALAAAAAAGGSSDAAPCPEAEPDGAASIGEVGEVPERKAGETDLLAEPTHVPGLSNVEERRDTGVSVATKDPWTSVFRLLQSAWTDGAATYMPRNAHAARYAELSARRIAAAASGQR